MRLEQQKAAIEASYRRDLNLQLEGQDSFPLKQKKIEEDYTMFEEQVDNEPELQEIIEEAFDEEDSDSDVV